MFELLSIPVLTSQQWFETSTLCSFQLFEIHVKLHITYNMFIDFDHELTENDSSILVIFYDGSCVPTALSSFTYDS